jgi:hypothetical protein
MYRDASVETLLRWRSDRAELEAPPPPRAATLIASLRPWWEREPMQFQVWVTKLQRMPVALGYAMSAVERGRGDGRVPAILSAELEVETYVQMRYVSVRQGRLLVRFALDVDGVPPFHALDTTFIDEGGVSGLFVAIAAWSASGEYRIDAALPAGLASTWENLKATDHLPFRLILQPRDSRAATRSSPEGMP